MTKDSAQKQVEKAINEALQTYEKECKTSACCDPSPASKIYEALKAKGMIRPPVKEAR